MRVREGGAGTTKSRRGDISTRRTLPAYWFAATSHAPAAAIIASRPVSSVEWMTGANSGEWFGGICVPFCREHTSVETRLTAE